MNSPEPFAAPDCDHSRNEPARVTVAIRDDPVDRLEPIEPPIVNGERKIYLRAVQTVLGTFCAIPGLRGDVWQLVTGKNREALERIAERNGCTRQSVSKICRAIEERLIKLGWDPVRNRKCEVSVERCRLAQLKVRARGRVAERLVMCLPEAQRDNILKEAGRYRPRRKPPTGGKPVSGGEQQTELNFTLGPGVKAP